MQAANLSSRHLLALDAMATGRIHSDQATAPPSNSPTLPTFCRSLDGRPCRRLKGGVTTAFNSAMRLQRKNRVVQREILLERVRFQLDWCANRLRILGGLVAIGQRPHTDADMEDQFDQVKPVSCSTCVPWSNDIEESACVELRRSHDLEGHPAE